jgi:hypothetical protein
VHKVNSPLYLAVCRLKSCGKFFIWCSKSSDTGATETCMAVFKSETLNLWISSFPVGGSLRLLWPVNYYTLRHPLHNFGARFASG